MLVAHTSVPDLNDSPCDPLFHLKHPLQSSQLFLGNAFYRQIVGEDEGFGLTVEVSIAALIRNSTKPIA